MAFDVLIHEKVLCFFFSGEHFSYSHTTLTTLTEINTENISVIVQRWKNFDWTLEIDDKMDWMIKRLWCSMVISVYQYLILYWIFL